MLRLLAQREQGYEDIAALMGLSVAEVRERVAGALKQLEEEGSGEPPPSTPPAAEAAETHAELTPAAEASSGADASASRAPAKRPAVPVLQIKLPASGGARAAIAAAAGALVVLVVVLIVGGGSGSSDSTTASGTSGEASAGTESALSGGSKQVTKAVLSGVGGSEATGVAIFGRVKNSLALQVEAEGLKPNGSGQSYAIWLAQSPQKMLPLASTAATGDGRIAAQFQVPTEVLAYLANETFGKIVVTEVDDSALKASLNKATTEKKSPEYTGTEVLSGTVTGPIVGAAKKNGQ